MLLPGTASAAVCSITTDTVIDQSYVDDPGNNCTSIDIQGNVSTTWLGTVNLGGGVVTVKSGYTMTMGSSSQMVLGGTDDFVVESSAVVSQTDQDPTGIRITARNISVLGSINTNGKGCSGSSSDVGFGPDAVTGACTLGEAGYGLSSSGGAGYGGRGGSSVAHGADVSATYGSSTYPDLLGSGGSAGGASGAGGGLVHLFASGTLTVDGSIYANGVLSSGGAGSGGSIYIHAQTLTGSGSIRANGSNANWCTYGGGGGGGRIAVYYAELGTFSLGNITALGGSGDSCRGGSNGENGTTYILHGLFDTPETDLRVTSGLDLASDLNLRHTNIVFDSGARIGCEAMGSLMVSALGTFTDAGAVWSCSANIPTVVVSSTGAMTLTGTSLSFTDTDVFTFSASDFVNNDVTVTVSKPGSRGSLAIRNPSLTLTGFTFSGAANAATTSAQGGLLSFPFISALSLVNSDIFANVSTTLTTLSVDALSSLSANGKGCPGSSSGAGFGPDPVTGVCTVGGAGAGLDVAGGAGYGGAGGSSGYGSGASLTYGLASYPYALGSGGSVGSAGGGRILLDVSATATINGTISANAAGGAGGGSGGSVRVSAGIIMGDGTVSANGSNAGWCGFGGGGGGGRVSLSYRALGTFDPSSISVAGGSGDGCRGGLSGESGSVHTLLLNQSPNVSTTLAPTSLVNGSVTGTNTPTFTFSLTDPDVSDTVKYEIQIDDSLGFGSPIIDYISSLRVQGTSAFQVGQTTGTGTYLVGNADQVLSDGAYYWRVKTIDAADAASSYATAHSGDVAFIVDTEVRSVQFTQASESEFESVASTSVHLSLDASHFEDVTVHYSLSGTADGGGVDYALASGMVTIPAGNTTATIPLAVVNDSIAEVSETVTITLSSPAFASIGTNGSFTYTILDDDTAGVTVSKASLSVVEGGANDSYTVVLTSAPTSTVTVTLTPVGLISLSTSTLSFTASDWSTPQTVTVSAVDDGVFEGAHSGTVSMSLGMNPYAYGYSSLSLGTISVSITDNDSEPVNNTSSGGGATSAGSGSGSAFALPVTWSFVPVPVSPSPVPSVSSNPSLVPPVTTILNMTDPARVAELLNGGPRDSVREAQAATLLDQDLRLYRLPLSPEVRANLSIFLTYGSSDVTARLGLGERRALLRDAFETMHRTNVPIADLERMARGAIPLTRDLATESAQLPRVRLTFRTLFHHDPNFQIPAENLAWNTLMYRLRFPRDLALEAQGIERFRSVFHRAPQDPFQWATVRVLGYIRG